MFHHESVVAGHDRAFLVPQEAEGPFMVNFLGQSDEVLASVLAPPKIGRIFEKNVFSFSISFIFCKFDLN